MYPVAKGDVLKKVSNYELSRKFDTLHIQVEHLLTGRMAGEFHADASFKGVTIDADFWGYGSTETVAVRDLLTKIKGIPFSELVPEGLPQTGGAT
jgi:hypothetical protein